MGAPNGTPMRDKAISAGNQQERLSTTEELSWFLAGFTEGEGSLCVSIKKHPTAKFGFYIQPEFFLYQHEDRRNLLEIAKQYFGCGSIHPKCGNESVLVYGISNRTAIRARVIPFYEKYMLYSNSSNDFRIFRRVLTALERKEHWRVVGMLNIIKLLYQMNPNAKSKGRKRPEAEVVARILRDHTSTALAGEDMVRPAWRHAETGRNDLSALEREQ